MQDKKEIVETFNNLSEKIGNVKEIKDKIIDKNIKDTKSLKKNKY